MRKRALKDFAASAVYGSFTIRIGVSASPFYGHLVCVCVLCEKEGDLVQVCVSVSVSVCAVQYFFHL